MKRPQSGLFCFQLGNAFAAWPSFGQVARLDEPFFDLNSRLHFSLVS